jgi:Cu-processing system ATP-binding protein
MSDIVVENVTKTYGSVTALDDVSLTVPDRSSFGLLGTNGAGKTTLFKLLIGHEQPDSGTLRIAGLTPEDGVAVRSRVGYLPEKASFPSAFSGREVLSFHADVRGVESGLRSKRISRALQRVGLSDAADRNVGNYSKGMNRRLGLATVLVSDPEVLLLDEPTSGLDPEGVNAFHDVINRYKEETDVTMVFSSHALTEINHLCDRIAVLHEGELRGTGKVDELRTTLSDTVRIDVWVTPKDTSEIVEELKSIPSARVVGRSRDRLTIECSRSESYGILEKIHTVTSVESFEVRQPGIEDVFRKAIDTGLETNTTKTE